MDYWQLPLDSNPIFLVIFTTLRVFSSWRIQKRFFDPKFSRFRVRKECKTDPKLDL